MSRTKFTIEDLFNLTGSVIYNPDDYKATSYVSIDSRSVKKGSIYVAIKGKKFDGHDFVLDALNKGAGAIVISNRKLKKFDEVEIPIITVPNTIKALGELANIKRSKLEYKVIGITGSNGKTTTKDFTATLLSEKFKASKTEANNNNHIGVPLTILNAKVNDEVVVTEIGTNHFGEIEYAAKIAQPDLALITNIGNAHTKYLKNKQGVLREKVKLFEVTNENNGTILLNVDDKLLKKLKNKFNRVITFGFSNDAEIKADVISYDKNSLPLLRVNFGKRKLEVKIPLAGEANLKNVFNAIVIAIVMGLNNTQIKNGIKKLRGTPGRFELIKLKNLLIINDAYNASPESMISAIKSLSQLNAKNKIAILGDMLELGESAPELHAKLAKEIKKAKIDRVFLVGKQMKNLANAKGIKATYFISLNKLLNFLRKEELTNSTVLIKASRGMQLEKVINYLSEKYE